MDIETLKVRIAARPWFHRINLGNGVITPGIDDSPAKLAGIRMPASLAGKSVLDIGTYDGFFAFEAERRGAARVLATDHMCWHMTGMGTKEGFDLVKEALASRVEDLDIAVEDL